MNEIRAALRNAGLGLRGWSSAPILGTDEVAYCFETGPDFAADWRRTHDEARKHGYVALVVTGEFTGPPAPLADRGEDLFSRYFFEGAVWMPKDTSPRAILERAARLSFEDAAEALREYRYDEEDFDAEELVDLHLDATHARFGTSPAPEQILQLYPESEAELEVALRLWEQGRNQRPDADPQFQDWYESEPLFLLLVPGSSTWDSLAYVPFYGAERVPPEIFISIGRAWERRHQAHLVCNFGTMLNCIVDRPPTTWEEAWPLALAHEQLANCTLAPLGFTMRHYAADMIGRRRWFLHERP